MLWAMLLLGAVCTVGVSDVGLTIWTEPAPVKVFKDSPPKAQKKISLQSARNEYESAQIVIRAGQEPLRNVGVQVSNLQGPKGKSISEKNIEIRLVGYVLIKHLNKYYPDPLLPYAPFDVPAGENQPVFLTVYVPKNTPAGHYKGAVVITSDNAGKAVIPLELEVWDFTLPDKPSSETAFGLWEQFIWKFEGIEPGTPEAKEMWDRYYWFLVEHRISPYFIPVDILSPEADRYLNDPRVSTFQIPYSEDVEEMRSRVERCREKGWLKKAYFYPLDEPVTREQYEELKRRVEKIKSIDPRLRIVSPFFRGPAFSDQSAYEALEGVINIWCAVTNYFDPQKQLQKKIRGDTSWWYVCCGPGSPYANFHITMDAIDHRILMWQQKKYQVDGLLYWATNWWGGTPDPYEDMATVKEINPDLYGDGSLLYPGKKVGHKGPISSLRLEMIRDGFEDYEYLTLLERAMGRPMVEKFIGEVVEDMTHFTKDPQKLLATRARIAEALLRRRVR